MVIVLGSHSWWRSLLDPAYSGNPPVNVMALGLMETEEIVKSGADGLGNPVLYVGSTTGRDGGRR